METSNNEMIASAIQSGPNGHRQARRAGVRFRPSAFGADKSGSVAIVFALMAVVVTSLIGGAIDFGRAYSMKARLQQAVDAASLAAASKYVNDPDHDVAAAIAVGTRFFNSTMSRVPGATMSSTLDPDSQTVDMVANVTVGLPFLSVIGLSQLPLEVKSSVTTTEGLSGGGGNNEVEISLMLDTTGSMGSASGDGKTKIQALKDAAKNFVGILLPDTGPQHARIALAPFSSNVNLGDTYVQEATGQPLVKTTTTTTSYQCNPVQTCQPAECSAYYTSGKKKGQCKTYAPPVCTTTYSTCTSSNTSTQYLSRCMTERTGASAFTDDEPMVGSFFPATWKNSENSAKSCTPGQVIVPLTSNKTVLKQTIDAFVASGSTAGQLGTAWAWYMLSPNWASVFTGESAPKAYGTEKLRKIAVLMTDGEFNLAYASGQGDSVAQAKALCDGMKAKGIEVYTVGFKLDNQTAIDTMAYCATDSNHAFRAEDAVTLEASFKEIAFRSVPLHISK
ncbi:MAG: pilus assembly protein [Hyphomicrobiaceae bacterium]